MDHRFIARVASAETDPDGDFPEPGVAEHRNGDGFFPSFMCEGGEPDEQDVSSDLDTHCPVAAAQGTAYGRREARPIRVAL
ncbi:hypothetical protein GCM10027160_24600 [Streptomyces calidiresistens]|uniref:Uncharacterized protein n=1 Tax=Streptomyces calidiresistens TaxID=1485586 RepID=A0A7W3T5P6_9ACTN|nr:hypothetical protein [Streptomyces calidiresistens]MBB0231392.1 hypothetical protein [Streptomyces calidiresistens]